MSVTPEQQSEFDMSLSPDDVIAELEQQVGVAAGQITRLHLILRKREDEVRKLRDLIATRDNGQAATRD